MTIPGSQQTPRILIIAEAVTLAHFARPVALAAALADRAFEIHLAVHPRYLELVNEPYPFKHHAIHSITTSQFTWALAKGQPLYDAATLTEYVEGDLALLESLRPNLVIGDFRLSLAISAPLAKIPYVSLINAYWSPYAKIQYEVPELPLTRVLGVRAGQHVFDLVRPLAFALHAMPLNRVRRRYGLPSLGLDLRHTYSWADYVCYPDLREAVPTRPLPAHHRFIGPVLWSPDIDLPDWWHALPTDRPVVYVTLGSSGRSDRLPGVLEALAALPVNVVASRAGRHDLHSPSPNVWVADYLPGERTTQRADLVICNGGSLTTYQALAAGVPVLGLPANMDQHLNMQAVERLGAGRTLRSEWIDGDVLREIARQILDNPSTNREAARQAAKIIAEYDPAQRLRELLTEFVG